MDKVSSLFRKLFLLGLGAGLIAGMSALSHGQEKPVTEPYPLNDLSVQYYRQWSARVKTYGGIELRQPNLRSFREEIARADAVILGSIERIVELSEIHAIQRAQIVVERVLKGRLSDANPVVQMIIPGLVRPIAPFKRLPRVKDQILMMVEEVTPLSEDILPDCQNKLYFATDWFLVNPETNRIESLLGFPPDMQPYSTWEKMEPLIGKQGQLSAAVLQKYTTGQELFRDDFDDHSFAGWVFLQGEQDPLPGGFERWMSPRYVLLDGPGPDGKLRIGKPAQDPVTGLFFKKDDGGDPYDPNAEGRDTWIGVRNGRLQLRTSSILQHLTVVSGDPEWSDYQIDVDLYNYRSRLKKSPEQWWNYLKCGIYGRVQVPNMPETRGEHSFVAVEIGDYANEGNTVSDHAIQIRVKYPENPVVVRDHSRWLRYTKILDYDAWKVPQDTRIQIRARFVGNRVEGWINGKRMLTGIIPSDHPGVRSGRIGLWTFETWAEFDNVRVTKLLPEKAVDQSDR